MANHFGQADISQQRLLRALAEQLKLPLLQIARQAEAGSPVIEQISETASMALQLIDGFLLSTDLHEQQTLQLQPVAVSAVLQTAAERLRFHAQQYHCELDIQLSGTYLPVMAHRESLEAALTMLGYSFIEAQTPGIPNQVVLAARRSSKGIMMGIFSKQPGLSADMFRRARALYGSSRQALPTFSLSAGTGVFIADSLLAPLATSLHVTRFRKLSGLATTLIPSQQLQIV